MIEEPPVYQTKTNQRLDEVESSAHSARVLARNMAKIAADLASNPWSTLKTSIQYKILIFFLNRPALISDKLHQKYTRLAERRDPARFVNFVDKTANIDTTASSAVSEMAVRAFEYSDYDATLTPVETDIRLIAFYLPQYHPFPENDNWWGKGFTEWTNVGKALPLFDGHYQPHCPIHFGYYDLRVSEVMEEQARVARQYGINGFAHHFYWFGGKTLMEQPLRSMLANPKVNIPFCLSWANENWTRRWDGKDSEVLIAQDYSDEDARAMIRHLADYFRDNRYIRVNGKPVLLVYRPKMIPNVSRMKDIWQDEAEKLGIGRLYLIGVQSQFNENHQEQGFDASVEFPPHGLDTLNLAPALDWVISDPTVRVYDYASIASTALGRKQSDAKIFRGVTLSWDNTARRQKGATIVVNFSIDMYRNWLTTLCQRLRAQADTSPDEKLIFINAWNEWAEGTHLEPDQRFGFAYLEATRQALTGPSGQ